MGPKDVDQHVGINVNSLASAQYVSRNTSLHSGQIANAWITYNATAKNLTVFWTYDTNPVYRGNEAILAHRINLKQVLPEQAVVGFSAATGILVSGLCAALMILRRRRLKAMKEKEEVLYTSITGDLERGAGPKMFNYRDLAAATNNFSVESWRRIWRCL
ncbi:hypothetical protein Syun_004357 [Stephania yunnanensis]|uniref:Legume lectin domain-containing protein n=1 Tax=Stephania yunnanensis TaxID=152371 RepID=A0AAP0L5E4_9MAGN